MYSMVSIITRISTPGKPGKEKAFWQQVQFWRGEFIRFLIVILVIVVLIVNIVIVCHHRLQFEGGCTFSAYSLISSWSSTISTIETSSLEKHKEISKKKIRRTRWADSHLAQQLLTGRLKDYCCSLRSTKRTNCNLSHVWVRMTCFWQTLHSFLPRELIATSAMYGLEWHVFDKLCTPF